MTKVRKWIYLGVCWGAWAGLQRLFWYLEAHMESALLAGPERHVWWALVFLYWLADTAIILCIAGIVRKPFGLRLRPGASFAHFACDGAVLVLLFHLALLCTDKYVFPQLVPIGLGHLFWVFLMLMMVWGIVMLFKYTQIGLKGRPSGNP